MQNHDDHRRWAVRSALCLAIAMGLAACGGGGGGGGANVRPTPPPVTPPPPPPPPSDNDDAEQPDFGDHLRLTGANWTIIKGLTGAGVTIGFVDTGVNSSHPALAGRVLENFVHVGTDNDLSVDDSVGHGTTVASLAAGQPVGQWPGGIAQDANIVSSRIISDQPPEDDGSGEGNEVSTGDGYGAYFAAINAELADAGATIINNSWGGLYWTDPAMTKEFADAYRDFVITRGGLIVFANGNAGDDPELRPNPSDNAALPSIDPYAADLEQGWLTVAALDPLNPDALTDYSQECGIAMDYCLAAPGNVVFTGYDDLPGDPTYWVGGGTSYAAPLVAGAAAVVWSAFPYFDNDLVRQTLLGNAKDLGAPGVDPVFGHGLLDVNAATLGPARFDWGDVVVTFTGLSVWTNPIVGDGGLTKRGDGELVLNTSGGLNYLGDTRVEGGTLRVDASLANSDVYVGPMGTLAGHGWLSHSIENYGTVWLDSSGTLVAGGDYIQHDGARLAVELGNLFWVNGQAQIEGGGLHILGVKTGYTVQSREKVLEAGGGVVGTFDDLTAASSIFLEGSLDYDSNVVWLDITRLDVSAEAQAMDLTAASLSGAARVEASFDLLDAGATAPAAPAFLEAAGTLQRTANAAAAERTLSSLSGEIHATDGAMAMLAMDDSRHALEQRLDATPRTGGWMASLDGRHDLGGISANVSGWMLGQELRSGDTTWGATVSRSEGTLWSGLRQDRGQELRSEGQLYAVRDLGTGYLMGSTSFGRVQRDLQRELALGEGMHVDSRYVDRYLGASVQAGRHLDVGAGTLTPYVGAQALQLQRGAFDEAGGAGFGLRADASGFAMTQALLGTRYRQAWSLGSAMVDLHGRIEWQRTLSQDGAIQASFTGIDASAPIALDALGRDTGVFNAGLGASWRSSRLTLDVDARNTLGATDLGAFARWTVAF